MILIAEWLGGALNTNWGDAGFAGAGVTQTAK